MVRIHEAVKAKRSLSDDSELPFLTSKEEFDILKEKLSDQQEKKKKLVSFFVFFVFSTSFIRIFAYWVRTGRGKDSSFGILEAMVYISKHCFVAQNYNFSVVSVTVLKI